MESGLEELRILQTVILLITTSNIVYGDSLGKVGELAYNILPIFCCFFAFIIELVIHTYTT